MTAVLNLSIQQLSKGRLCGSSQQLVRRYCEGADRPLLSTTMVFSKQKLAAPWKVGGVGRGFSSKHFVSPKMAAKFHAMDGLSPKNFTLIYKTDFQIYLIICQGTVAVSIGAVLAAFAGLAFGSALENQGLTEEEKMERKNAAHSDAVKREKEEDEYYKGTWVGQLRDEKVPVFANPPRFSEMLVQEGEVMGMFLLLLVSLSFSLYRLMGMVPARIYVGQKGYCVGVHYGSIIPGKKTRHEFLAGTLKLHKSPFGKAEVAYKDGSGRSLVLIERFFRKPADFDYLRGIVKNFDHTDYSRGSDVDQMKLSGGYGSENDSSKKTRDS